MGEKRCGGICAKPHPTIGCGLDGCDPCPDDPGLKSECVGTECPVDAYASHPANIPPSEGCADPIDTSAVPPPPLTNAVCPDPYGEWMLLPEDCCRYRCFQGHHYYFCHPTGASADTGWHRANALCRASGMHLAQIDNYTENYFIYIVGRMGGWIGLNNVSEHNVFRWSTTTNNDGPILIQDGKFVPEGAYHGFAKDTTLFLAPQHCVNQDCAAYDGGDVGAWNIQPDPTSGYAFTCESGD